MQKPPRLCTLGDLTMVLPDQRRVRLVPGQTFDKYRVIREAGRGATAVVYQALYETPVLSRSVALKVFEPDALGTDGLTRLSHEARVLSELDSEHIVDFYEASLFEGTPFMVMQWLEGETLQAMLQRERYLPWQVAAQLMLDVCKALQVAHDAKILHRDIKPSNCFRVQRPRNPYAVKVLDFGIAKPYEISGGKLKNTTTNTIIGTAHYIAPEVLETRPSWPRDERSDLYSVGVMLYQLTTGTLPFEGSSRTEVDFKTVHTAPQPPSERAPAREIPRALEDVILRALQKDPRARFGSMDEMEAALRSIPGVVPAPPATLPRSQPSHARAGEIESPGHRTPSNPHAAALRSTGVGTSVNVNARYKTARDIVRRDPGDTQSGDQNAPPQSLVTTLRTLSPQTRQLAILTFIMLVALAVLVWFTRTNQSYATSNTPPPAPPAQPTIQLEKLPPPPAEPAPPPLSEPDEPGGSSVAEAPPGTVQMATEPDPAESARAATLTKLRWRLKNFLQGPTPGDCLVSLRGDGVFYGLPVHIVVPTTGRLSVSEGPDTVSGKNRLNLKKSEAACLLKKLREIRLGEVPAEITHDEVLWFD